VSTSGKINAHFFDDEAKPAQQHSENVPVFHLPIQQVITILVIGLL